MMDDNDVRVWRNCLIAFVFLFATASGCVAHQERVWTQKFQSCLDSGVHAAVCKLH